MVRPEAAVEAAAAGGAAAARFGRVGEDRGEGGGEGGRVLGRHQPAGLAADHHLRDAAHRAGHDGHAGLHRFEDHQRHALVGRGDDEGAAGGEQGADAAGVAAAEEGDGSAEAELGGARFEGGAVLAVAGDH